jgi:hypothetical protein
MIAIFFDFIFYRVYTKYTEWGELDVPGVYALGVITLFPCLNILSLIFFGIDILNIKSWNYDKGFVYLCFFIGIFFNYFRIYKKIGLSNLLNKWDNTDKEKKIS